MLRAAQEGIGFKEVAKVMNEVIATELAGDGIRSRAVAWFARITGLAGDAIRSAVAWLAGAQQIPDCRRETLDCRGKAFEGFENTLQIYKRGNRDSHAAEALSLREALLRAADEGISFEEVTISMGDALLSAAMAAELAAGASFLDVHRFGVAASEKLGHCLVACLDCTRKEIVAQRNSEMTALRKKTEYRQRQLRKYDFYDKLHEILSARLRPGGFKFDDATTPFLLESRGFGHDRSRKSRKLVDVKAYISNLIVLLLAMWLSWLLYRLLRHPALR